MSDHSTEDEIRAELRQFARSLPALLRLHAQAGNWLERRQIRKQISRTLREQRREEDTARGHQLSWTQRMVENYRAHSLTVAERAHNPNIDHTRRHEDHLALRAHADGLRARIAVDERLTVTERGIALDGLDAATTFPEFEPGRLFRNAHKVKGREALHYRAQVARVLGADTYTRQLRAPHQQDREPADRITARQNPQPGRDRDQSIPPSAPTDRDHEETVGRAEGDRLAAVETEVSHLRGDRDRLDARVGVLQRGVDAVTADRDELRGKLATVGAEVAGLRTRNQRLLAEIGDLREREQGQGQPVQRSVAEHLRHFRDERDQARRERDRYQRERDQARAELARRDTDHDHERRDTHRDESAPLSSATGEAVREWNETVGRNIAEALEGIEHPEIAKRDLGQVRWDKFTTGTESAEDVARWWVEDGATAYWAEQSTPDRSAERPRLSRPENTQPWQPDREKPARERRNRHRRNGIERSR
ncbi:hypothetical protein [Nocardia bovistercoris]|uniref:Uncharacterized protein n=1 Tax=Nocardia bovistercoris TaxID=2785916 RepID=A0A931N0V2_9NOCA|nr:hypothetical protein [Nocardia bovistercoris]MBH0775057.1 hypothetical protein [Nocardia bovistercoris]